MKTIYFKKFQDNTEHVRNSAKCAYSLKLFYANLVTLMETYLSDVFTETVSADSNLMKKLTKSSRYKNQNVSLHTALTNDMKRYIIGLVRQTVFHNLSNVRPLFREVLDIEVPNEQQLLNIIEKRHHIIHRNGFDRNSRPVQISETDIGAAADYLTDYIERIDQQFVSKFQMPTV